MTLREWLERCEIDDPSAILDQEVGPPPQVGQATIRCINNSSVVELHIAAKKVEKY